MVGLTTASKRFYTFFRDGFRGMTIGRTLWAIVIAKLFIMFAILKVFFFPNFLNQNFDTEKEKADHVVNELIMRGKQNL